jgi:hypothetical protein
MANEVMDWDSAYRQEGVFEGPPPWNIGAEIYEMSSTMSGSVTRRPTASMSSYCNLTLATAGAMRGERGYLLS